MKNYGSNHAATPLYGTLDALQKTAVLVVGDIMLDRFVYGAVNRISPESPVPVLSIKRENAMPGGAGNVAANLRGLGAKTFMVSLVGSDMAADTLRALLTQIGADISGLVTDTARPTTLKTRYLAAHQQLLRTDEEQTGALSAALEDEILSRALSFLPAVQAVILSDYGKGLLTEKIIGGVIKAARDAGIPVLVDPKKPDYKAYSGAAIVTPNSKELGNATGGMPVGNDGEVTAAAQKLAADAGIDSVVATRSRDGMTIVQREGKSFAAPVHLRTEAREVFDVSGAGDTVIATIAAATAAGLDLVQAASLANIAAGLVVAKVGTAPVRADELRAALDGQAEGAFACDADAALETVQRWRARGLKIGFTNGCFDILHAGHVRYLANARGRCDKLIIGLNADASVRRLKGTERPVNDETARAAVLSALSAVDMVVLFGTDTDEEDKPLRLIERLKPDLYFKGGDYTVETLPETPLVRAYGGAVEIMPFHEGFSTSATIHSLKSSKVA